MYAESAIGPVGGPLNLSIMPGMVPLPYESEQSVVTPGVLEADGFHISTDGGETLIYSRSAPFDVNRGAVAEAAVKIVRWHPAKRTGVFMILDDGLNAYMLSFVDTDGARYVCIPLSSGSAGFQELVGPEGAAAKLSYQIDWTQMHTYRLERRPRDGVYLFIDNAATPALVLPETARYSFPTTKLSAQVVAFGQFTDEGAESVWEFMRDCFGSGFEISTEVNDSVSDLRARLSNSRATVIITAGS